MTGFLAREESQHDCFITKMTKDAMDACYDFYGIFSMCKYDESSIHFFPPNKGELLDLIVGSLFFSVMFLTALWVKDLPELENEILEDISNYEQHSGTMFLINIINFAEFFEKQWIKYQEEKKIQKLERQKQRSEKLDSVYTPNKRSLFRTPISAPSKLLRTNATLSTTKTGRLQVTPKTPTAVLPSQILKKSTSAARRLSPRFASSNTPNTGILREKNGIRGKNVLNAPSTSHDTTSYSAFARELVNRVEIIVAVRQSIRFWEAKLTIMAAHGKVTSLLTARRVDLLAVQKIY